MTSPALYAHSPRELTDVLIADRERLRKWISHISRLTDESSSKLADRIAHACFLALMGQDPP